MSGVATRRDLSYRRRRARRRARAARWLTILVVPVLATTLFALVTGWASRGPAPVAQLPDPPTRSTTTPQPGRPPQFVIASFDGAGDAGLWRSWREVGRRTGARFTFFLSGVYLLGEERRVLYQPPEHEPGSSDIGFMQRSGRASSARRIGELLVQLAAGHAEGHEIATHFNGHFCAPYDGSVGEWTAADWRQELAQFDELLARASALNGLDPVELGFGPADVVGARTPCLEGKPRAARRDDVRRIEEQTLASYLNAFQESYRGDRAPFAVGNHFARWNHGAYVRALTRFLERVCRLPQVRCASYAAVADWLDDHYPRGNQSSRSRQP
jgi:hypothetical protein